MTLEEWCWMDGVARQIPGCQLLGSKWTLGMLHDSYALADIDNLDITVNFRSRPTDETCVIRAGSRVVSVLGGFYRERVDDPLPGSVRLEVHHLGAEERGLDLTSTRVFSLADPDSIDKAAAFVRGTYSRQQRRCEQGKGSAKNAPCICGSGRKRKRCCGSSEREASSAS